MSDPSSSSVGGRRAVAWWQRPSVLALGVTVLVLGAGLAWPVLHMMAAPPEVPGGTSGAAQDLPWQVQTEGLGEGPGGAVSQVFGLRLGQATLADVQARFPADLSVALVVPQGSQGSGAPALEAFVESFRAGFVTAKLVLAFEASPQWLQQAQARAPASEVSEGGRSRRYTLAADDVAEARRAPLLAMSLVPSARLDEAVVVQRFGQPAERLTGPAGELQLLYPATGVAVVLPPAEGEAARAKAVIQYVAPAQFERRLRAPLKAATAGAAASAASTP